MDEMYKTIFNHYYKHKDVKVQALKQTSIIDGAETYYIVIGEGENKVIIVSGLKNYEKVGQLLKEEEAGKPIEGKHVIGTEKYNVKEPIKGK